MSRPTLGLPSLTVLTALTLALPGAHPGAAATLHGKGQLTVPPPGAGGLESVEVAPLATIEGDGIGFSWRFEVQSSVSDGSRQASLVLYQHYRVDTDADLSGRLDLAFFDAEGRLLHTWETEEYSLETTPTDDPEEFPTWIVFETSDDYGMPVESLLAVRSYQVVVRTTEN